MGLKAQQVFVLALLFLTLISLTGLVTGCKKNTQYRITSAERARADTLYLAQIDSINATNDSICVRLKEEKLQFLVDSIITLRKAEASALKARNRSLDGPN